MPRRACTFREHRVERGFRAVTLENETISVTVLPDKGADIYRLVYKPCQIDVLWKSPWGLKRPGTGLPIAANTEETWLEGYEGGWQEIFPNGGDSCLYKGCHLNFHGEASILPWDFQVRKTSSRVSAVFTVSLFRSPFLLRRELTIESGRPTLLISERISNLAEEDMHFMWGHHPAFGAPFLAGECRIQLPGGVFQAHDVEISPASKIPAKAEGEWPLVPGKDGPVDLSIVPPPNDRHSEFGYVRNLAAGWYAIASHKYGFGFGLAWPREVYPYLWVWQELRGSFGFPWYGRCYVMAIEPFTSIPGTGLQNAIAAGTAPVLRAGGSIEASLAVVFIPGCDRIDSIELDGTVRMAVKR
jgi:uncharacterized protein DUF4432